MSHRASPLSQWLTRLPGRFATRRRRDASLDLVNTLDWLARLRTL